MERKRKMWKKLIAFLLLAAGAFTVGVAIYDPSIITNFVATIQTRLQTGLPTLLTGMAENPVATAMGAVAVAAPILTIGKVVWDIKKKAEVATAAATAKMDESSKIAYDSVKQVEQLKTEYADKTTEQTKTLQESQNLTTKLQLENDRLKRENEQLKTEFGMLKAEHDKLFGRIQVDQKLE